MVGRKNKKPFVAPAGWQKRRKVENPPRYHSSLFPVLETHSTGYHHIPATVTGAPVCIYFQFDAAAVQPVRQLDRAVPRTNRHFSERIALLTTLCHCVFVGCIIARGKPNVNSFFARISSFVKVAAEKRAGGFPISCKINTRKMRRPAPAGSGVRIRKKIEISDGGIRTFFAQMRYRETVDKVVNSPRR